jgi:membrane associated rhomboid family serine protease/tetratricopeptide (TPR) repeat protein
MGDELLDLEEFEGRIRGGQLSPQCLVRFPALTGEAFVPACELQLWKSLHEPRRAYFSRAFALFRFPWLTVSLIAVNLAVHLWSLRSGPLDMDAMVRFGGKAAPLIVDLGELWRLVTANFLHWNLLHLGVNMFVLFNVGGALENAYRRLDYLFLLVVSGIATMTVSLVAAPLAVTVGASGMVYGCLGGLIVFGLKYRTILPAPYRRILGEAAIPLALLLLLMGFTSPGVDNAAHLGGILAGMAIAPFLRPRLLVDAPRWPWWPAVRALPSAALLALVLFGGQLLMDTLPPLRFERDEAFGISVVLPSGWRPGANRFGQLAFFNGLPGVGRATFAAGASTEDEPADALEHARRFIEEQLTPAALGPDVLRVSHREPAPARIADRDALLVRADVDEPFGRTELLAYFVPRGNLVYRLVFSFPGAKRRYGRIVDQMASSVRFEEPQPLREARAKGLLFPHAPWALGELGTMLHHFGESTAAIDALGAAVRRDPSAVSHRARLALALLHSGQIEAGCRASSDAVLYGPMDPFALEADARCELARGNADRALERIREARQANPSDPKLARAEAALREAVSNAGSR